MSKLEKTLLGLRNEIVKNYGEDALAPIYDGTTVSDLLTGKVKTWLPTDLEGMDKVLGKKDMGYPSGKLIEIFGSEGQGKSSLAYYLLGQIQRQGGIGVLFDTELSYDPDWAEKLGADNQSLVVITPTDDSCLETYFDMIEEIGVKVRRSSPEAPLLVVVDTIYCTPTLEQLKSKSYKDTQRMAALSRALSTHLPVLCKFIRKQDIALIFLNQVRDNIGVMFGEKLKTPGGHALLHMCTVRAQVRRLSKGKDGSIESIVANHKNKVASPFAKARIQISPKEGLTAVVKKGDDDEGGAE